MASYLDMQMFSTLVRAARRDRNLREMAKITGISASTISRIERGATPDMATFLAVCDWLKVPTSEFIKDSENTDSRDYLSICAQLRSDRRLALEVGNALAALIEAAYKGKL